MIEVRRLGGIAAVSAVLMLILLGCELILISTTPWWPRWLRNDWAVVESQGFTVVSQQIAEMVRLRADEQEPPLGVLIGASQAWWDVDSAAFESGVRPRRQWHRLPVLGASMVELETFERLLIDRAGVRPKSMIIGISLGMLARSETYRKPEIPEWREVKFVRIVPYLRQFRFRAVEWELRWLVGNVFNTCFPNRTRIPLRLQSRLQRARLALSESLGQPFTAVVAPQKEPSQWKTWAIGQKTPESVWQEIEMERSEGRFDPSLYSPASEASQSLVEMVRLSRSIGAEPTIVIMPAASMFRREVPPEARRSLYAALRDAFGDSVPRVIDLEDSMPDELFLDLHHLNERGRAAFTPRLIDELKRSAESATTP